MQHFQYGPGDSMPSRIDAANARKQAQAIKDEKKISLVVDAGFGTRALRSDDLTGVWLSPTPQEKSAA